jgi:SPX domain protein involved in polyphosphate accumulation
MIENDELIPVISTSYNRQSFFLNKDPLIRVTLDSNLWFTNNKKTFTYDKYIVELKIPKYYDEQRIEEITKYLTDDCNIKLKIVKFSKFDYGFEKIKDYFTLQSALKWPKV